jgi:hypothetical protein
MEGDARSRMRCSSSDNNVPVLKGLAALVVVLCSGIISGCRAWDCAATDRQTLLDFKAEFVDSSGVFSTWDSSTNCCTWSGVTCRESDGAVLELTVVGSSGSNQQAYAGYNNGTVGAGLVSLTHLEKLKIQWVLFNGPIPSQWGEFSGNLVVITINNANLRDNIPSSLASIQNLETLDLKSNHLTNYLLVPTCFQGQNNVTVIYQNQGQSTSPGTPASAGSIVAVTSVFVFVFGTLSSALLLLL